MTDLVRRLRDCEFMGMPDARLDYSTATEAADRIEALEAQIAAAYEDAINTCELYPRPHGHRIAEVIREDARAALATYEATKETDT